MKNVNTLILFLLMGCLYACQKDEIAPDPVLSISTTRFDLLFYDTVLQVSVATNVDYEVVPEKQVSWLTELPVVDGNENTLHRFQVEANEEETDRSLSIHFRQKDGKLDRTVLVRQSFHRRTYIPADYDESGWEEEVKAIFTDELCSALKTGISRTQVKEMKNAFLRTIAQSMLDSTYRETFRIQDYIAFPTVKTTMAQMKTSEYNSLENPTGMFFEAGIEVVVLVGDTQNEEIKLKVHDFNPPYSDVEYALRAGVNRIRISHQGLGYIKYYTDRYEVCRPVKVHIAGGKVNGYFDKLKHEAGDWTKLLNTTVYDYFDVIGERINLAFTTDGLRTYCRDGKALIDGYDEIVTMEQELMGLEKYNKRPKNKMFARTVESGLFADGWGAGFAKDCMVDVADPDRLSNGGLWVIAHELGHVNQIRPGLKWVSTTEVTNNVYSICLRYHYTPDNMDLEYGKVSDGDYWNVRGGRFNSYLTYGVAKGEQWLCQRGCDKMEGYENGGDHFVKLCPLWQLMLYYRMASTAVWHKPDCYGDVAEIVRNTDETGMSNGQLQLNFMRNVCDVVQEDLTEFFYRAGMLKPIDKNMDDYVRAQLTITQEECDALRAYASKYPKPVSPVIYYLTANSLEAFEKRLPVDGMYGAGVFKVNNWSCQILRGNWKNVVVFETWKGNELTHVSMVGAGSDDRQTTSVWYPVGSTRIEAVGWDGSRTLVYGSR